MTTLIPDAAVIGFIAGNLFVIAILFILFFWWEIKKRK